MSEQIQVVAKAYPNDSGRGIARLDPNILNVLELKPGDIIEIDGEKRTAAKVWRLDRNDWEQNIIRIDGFIRQNAGVGIGDSVKIKKAEVMLADKIVLGPVEGVSIQFNGEADEMVKRQIMKRPVTKGDIIPIMSTRTHPFLGKVVTGQAIPLIVIEAEPEGIVLIAEETAIRFDYKPPEKEREQTQVVAKAYPNDAGRGIARLDPNILNVLELKPGDIIEIEGEKRTAAKVWRADRNDWEQNIIRIDRFIRQNAGIGIGDSIKIKKAEVKPAEMVVLAPSEGTSIQFKGEADEMVKRQIMKRPITKGDIIPVMSTMAHPFLGKVVTGQAIPLIVTEAEPEGIVLIDEKTVIRFDKPPEKELDLNIFLCHSSEDKSKVRELYYLLRKNGFNPWLDEEKLLPGQDWALEIQKAVKASDVVIVCLSNKSISKTGYVQKEIKYALDIADKQPEGSIFLIPLKLEECEVPERLCRWHWVNFFEDGGYERLILSLSTVKMNKEM